MILISNIFHKISEWPKQFRFLFSALSMNSVRDGGIRSLFLFFFEFIIKAFSNNEFFMTFSSYISTTCLNCENDSDFYFLPYFIALSMNSAEMGPFVHFFSYFNRKFTCLKLCVKPACLKRNVHFLFLI